MRRKLRNLFAGILGLLLVFFGFVRRAKRKAFLGQYITSIYFHNPNKKLFRKCIHWLKKNGYVFITSEQLVDIIKNKNTPPMGAVWISFDDGWLGNMHNVVPIIIKKNIPVTFFLSTDPIKNTGVFWWTYAMKFRKYLPVTYRNNIRMLWHVDECKRKQILKDLEIKFANKVKREAMTIQDVRYLSTLPQITLGSHTVHHVLTPNCSDSELDFEILNSKTTLENWIGEKIFCFSYPNGYYDGREVKILQKYFYDFSATTENRLVTTDENLFKIPRFAVMNDGFFSENLCHMVGIWQPFVNNLKQVLNYFSK